VINLIGTYECKLDAKGRFMLPISLKKQLNEEVTKGFVLKKSIFQPCLELYTIAEWNLILSKIRRLNPFKRRNKDFIRKFTAGIKLLDIDSTGRILIPKDLMQPAGLEKDIIITSTVNCIEIWNNEYYYKEISHDLENFADLTQEIMGNNQELL